MGYFLDSLADPCVVEIPVLAAVSLDRIEPGRMAAGEHFSRVSDDDRQRIESPPKEPLLDLDQRELEAAARNLADHIGPIARIVVDRALAECSTRDAFYQRLAEKLMDPAERDEFLRRLG